MYLRLAVDCSELKHKRFEQNAGALKEMPLGRFIQAVGRRLLGQRSLPSPSILYPAIYLFILC